MKQFATQFARLRHLSLRLVCISVSLSALVLSVNGYAQQQNASTTGENCTLFYRLNGLAMEEFSTQKQQLTPHLQRKKIVLVDIQSWHKSRLSGRERMRIQKQYEFPRSKDFAVLVNASGDKVKQYANDVDLVSVLLDCKH